MAEPNVRDDLPLVGGIVGARFNASYYTHATRLERLSDATCRAFHAGFEGYETRLDGLPVIVEIKRR